MDIFQAIILGITEGLTEFLPVSSTGHMILVAELIGLNQSDFIKTFEISVQLGSILAVVFLFFNELRHDRSIWLKLAVSFIPTGAIGFLLYSHIKTLFSPITVAYMLLIGGVVFIISEFLYKPSSQKITSIKDISLKQAFIIGLCQSLAMIPGTSRSGATIVCGLAVGLERRCAAQFSFLLAIPTMFAATGYDTMKNYNLLMQDSNLLILGIGMLTAFITAIFAIKIFLNLISRFGYIPFGIYRILLGGGLIYWMS